MRTITIRSFAKLNLTFEILESLPGGYHSVRTLFQSIDLADTLFFKLMDVAPEEDFDVEIIEKSATTPRQTADIKASFPLNEDNLIVKAAKRFERESRCGAGQKLVVSVNKQIPIAAGMAGGSGNAAAAIRAMQEFFPDHALSDLGDQVASSLGSDINFCLHGGTQIGTSRGEVLNPVSKARRLAFLIVKPRGIAISTPWVFRQYDERLARKDCDLNLVSRNYTAACCDALTNDSLQTLSKTFFNSFEEICFEHYPQVQSLRDAMLEAGCLSAHITGSGPTLFGLLPSENLDESIAAHFHELAERSADRIGFDCWLSLSTGSGLAVSLE